MALTTAALVLGWTAVAVGAGSAVYSGNRGNKASKQANSAALDQQQIQQQAMEADQLAADKLAAAPGKARAAANAAQTKRKRSAARSQSVRTSPLGVSGEAGVAKKALLGA